MDNLLLPPPRTGSPPLLPHGNKEIGGLSNRERFALAQNQQNQYLDLIDTVPTANVVLCIKPFKSASKEFGCGQCLPCRLNRQRVWAARIVLESCAYKANSFITLSYADEHLPQDGSLSKAHWREFTNGIGFRYFGCGEYGSRTFRPHYHFVLFGIDAAAAESLALARWPYGFVASRPFVLEHARYVAGYVVKKLNRHDDDRLPQGCIPEFANMSRRPAVGRYGLFGFHEYFFSRSGSDYLAKYRDVPTQLRIGGRIFPLGSTMRRWLREDLGVSADDPDRTMSREADHKAFLSCPDLVAKREARRVSRYERLKALSRRPKGYL